MQRSLTLRQRWLISVSVVAAYFAVVGGLVYAVGNAISDIDLDFETGPAAQTRFDRAAMPGRTPVWSARTGAAVSSPATIVEGAVYVRNRQGDVEALDASTGRLRWSTPAGGGSVSGVDFAPVVAQGLVHVTGWDGVLYAFDAATGATRWTADLDTSSGLAPGGYPLAVADGTLYVNAKGISAFDASTGRARWTATTGRATPDMGLTSYSLPVVANRLLYVGGNDGAVHALDLTTGALRWSSNRFPARPPGADNAYDLFGMGPTSSLTVAGGVVYAAGRDGQLHALDAASGAERWTAPIGTINPFGSAPVVTNSLVYVQTDALHALDAATGAERWVTATGSGVSIYAFVPPVVSSGVVYVVGGDARLHEVDAATGAPRGATGRVPSPPKRKPLVLPSVLAVAPAIASDVVYLGSGDHRVYAYRIGPA